LLLRPWAVMIKTDIYFSGTGAAHPRAPADPNLRPWALATIKNTLNQLLFLLLRSAGQ
jgi:hypothetical protein